MAFLGSADTPAEFSSLQNGIQVTGGDIIDGSSNVIYDQAQGHVPNSVLQYTSIDVNAGNGLQNGGTVSLNGSTTLDINTSDIIGSFLSQASDVISVNISDGLTGSSNNIIVDESYDFTFSSTIDFAAGLNVESDILDGTQVIWSASNQEIPDSALGSISNGTLANSSITASPGNGLTGGGSTDLGSSFSIGIASGAIQLDELDESISPTWSSSHVFDAGITMGSAVDMDSSSKVINLPDPVDVLDAANKRYVDSVAEGLNIKESTRAATDGSNIDLTSSTDPNPVDGVSLANGDRILLKDQNTGTENGIYEAVTATDPTSWVRADDFNEDAEVTSGSFTFVREGTQNANVSFVVITNDPITLGSTSISFDQFGSAEELFGGIGLSKDGQTLNVDVPGLSGFGVESSNDDFRISSEIAGDGLTGASGSALSIVASDFAGNGITDDGSGNLTLTNDSVTVTAADGLSNGGSVTLGSSVSLSINPIDFAGSFLSEDGSNNLQVDTGTGLVNDGSGNLSFDESVSYSFTSTIDFGLGLNTSGDIVDNASQTSLTIWNSGTQYIPQDRLENTSIGIAGNNISLGESISFGLADLSSLDLIGNDLIDNGAVIWDSSNQYIPDAILENNSVSISAGNGLTGGGSVSLGGSTSIDIATNGIQLDEIDQGISPTWTGKHTFNGGIEFGQLTLPTDPGNSTLSNAAVTSTPAQGDEQSYSLDINSEPIITAYSEADGVGGIQNKEARVNGDIKATGELTEGSAL